MQLKQILNESTLKPNFLHSGQQLVVQYDLDRYSTDDAMCNHTLKWLTLT